MDNIRLICRMCLQCNDLVNILSDNIKNTGLWTKINIHLGQQVSENDDLPEFICLQCIKVICDFDLYCIRVTENQDFLRKNFTIIKVENEEGQGTEKETTSAMNGREARIGGSLPLKSTENMPIIIEDEPSQSSFECGETSDNEQCPLVETDDSVLDKACDGNEDNEMLHKYSSDNSERNIPEHVKSFIHQYPKIIMKDGRYVVQQTQLVGMMQNFYVLKCQLCLGRASRSRFKTINGLFSHYRKSHKVQGYVTCCDRKFRNRNEMVLHMVWHLQPSAFRCSVCGKKEAKPTKLISHMKCHESKGEEERKRLRCDECGIRMKSKHFLEIHKLKVHSDCGNELLEGDINEPHPNFPGFPKSITKNGEVAIRGERMTELINKFFTFTCDMCTEFETFPNFKNLLEHYQNVHSVQGYATCCGSKFKIRTKLIYHMARHLDPDAFKCRYCGRIMERLGKLKEHMMTHKSEEERVNFCHQCPKRYATQAGLVKHMISHIPKDQRKKHPCKVCGKVFDYLSNLHNHLKGSHNDEHYVCHICGKMFKSIFVFKEHGRRHDPSYVSKIKNRIKPKPKSNLARILKRRKIPSRICPHCSKEFPTRKAIVEHVEEEHDGLHKCPHCHYSNTKFELYLRHMDEKHLLDRKYICSICGAKFEYESKLKYHMNGHTREKIYRCQFCGKEYISLSGFCRHGRECHAEEYKQLKAHNRQMRKLKKEPLEEVEVDENATASNDLDFSIFLTTDE